MKSGTLTRRLFLRLGPVILLTIAAVSGLAFYSAREEINFEYDAQLINSANILWALIQDELHETKMDFPKEIGDIDLNLRAGDDLTDSADAYANARMFRAWRAGQLIMYSDTARQEAPKNPPGFTVISHQNEDWVLYTVDIPDTDVSIEVGEKKKLREILAQDILLDLTVPMLLLIPITGVLIWYGIAGGLGGIRFLVDQIQSRSPDDLSHVEIARLPDDLLPLAKELNQLFSKLEYSFTIEKRFTDHAAHQLRTPQATISLQLQMLAAATTDAEKAELIQELMESNDRATRLVAMLLTSARMHHQPISLLPVAAYPAIASVIAELGMHASQKSIEISLEGPEEAAVMADETLFKLMMSNLIENAIKFTPAGGSVDVVIRAGGKGVTISVCDTGCGIPVEERELVFGRFYRVETPQQEGSGLGLALVAEIIERFSGTIAIKTPPSGIGTLVELELPQK
ncbi:MAG: HAMP domain-containing histidine kinase [Alphaproteobacteria bacterium]|nr:HAMP domain-containing histidine kinase [Alphaproteobacteria bacterium]